MSEIWDNVLAWYHQSSEADMGLRSSFGSITARLEGQGSVTDARCTWPSYDRQAVGRLERVVLALRKTSHRTREVLACHYSGRRLEALGIDSRLGRLSRVALLLASEAGEQEALVVACHRGSTATIGRYLRMSGDCVRQAHEEYWAKRDAA